MPTNETDIAAPLDAVWDVLLDPHAYVQWVVGGRTIRDVDDGWPRPGTAFHHTAGMWPVVVKDKTKVVELTAQQRIVLEAKARPAGTALVVITLGPGPDGATHVTLVEEPKSGPVKLLPRGVIEVLTRTRNAESLRRLRNLVEERARARS